MISSLNLCIWAAAARGGAKGGRGTDAVSGCRAGPRIRRGWILHPAGRGIHSGWVARRPPSWLGLRARRGHAPTASSIFSTIVSECVRDRGPAGDDGSGRGPHRRRLASVHGRARPRGLRRRRRGRRLGRYRLQHVERVVVRGHSALSFEGRRRLVSDPATTLTLFIQPGEKNTGPSGMRGETICPTLRPSKVFCQIMRHWTLMTQVLVRKISLRPWALSDVATPLS